MAAGGDETRKMMGDPYALGGFVPDRDRHGIKYCNIEFGTGKVTTKATRPALEVCTVSVQCLQCVRCVRCVYSVYDTSWIRPVDE